ncbi:hypothetical protein KQ874_00270 [Mycoplasma sp. ES3157-GEN-MYC]|uniref:hypothetical protein n=1 Tax=Mycoplasma miroungigenitalium TaxID=754515 RepID=UPI001C10C58A|nr:hypothetical protein [Mycoplasma miroungigenitalium]MBU4690141.1 hypothetical protein [Mycoplasma miroungigenitalium]MBU4691414.1 hypothetical protein [Mycoplasma miroungigenitalium]
MEKNKFVKYKHHVRPYFWTVTISSILTVLLVMGWSQKFIPFKVDIKVGHLDFWSLMYLSFTIFFGLIGIYSLSVILVINSFVYKLERMKELWQEKDREALKKRINRQAIILDMFALNKSLSYNLYQASKIE